jgi:2-succinyl-6-hydroxy-2,4-cyclohexadiene-1-carboxylate synthase
MPELKADHGRPSIWFDTMGEESKEPLVLLHGFTGTHRTWDKLSERLSQDHFLILPDLPGHGRSGVSTRDEMGVGKTSEAIAEVIRTATTTRGPRKAALVGYSLGGRVALDLACKHQELLSCLVLEGASPGIEREDEREERRTRDADLADEIRRKGVEWFVDYWQETPMFATQKDLPPSVFQGIRHERLSNTAGGLAMSLSAAGAGEMPPLWDALKDITIPVLMIVGKKDAKYSATADAMRRRIPRSMVAEIEGAGHCPHLEAPEEFEAVLALFLDGPSSVVTMIDKKGTVKP